MSLDAIKDDGLTRDAFFEQMKRNDERKIAAIAYYSLMYLENILGPEEKDKPPASMYSIKKVVGDMASVIMMMFAKPKFRLSVKALLKNMRIVMHRYLIWEGFQELYSHDFRNNGPTKLNLQEHDIWLQPSLDEPTEDDVNRVLHLGKSMAWFNQSFSHIELGGSVTDVPGMNEVPEEVAATHVGETWKRWRKLRDQKPSEALSLRQGGAVLEYAMFYLRTVQLAPKSEATIDESLSLLLQAADGGHKGARGIVSHLYDSLGRGFPTSREIELAWLRDGICNGSETAKRRLQSLDPELYAEAVILLRTRFSGLGIETPPQYWDQDMLSDDELYEETRIRHQFGTDADQWQTVLLCSISNHLELLRRLTDHGFGDVNQLNEWNETPLLWASRAGHRDIVFHLLDCGADASVANDEGAIPLHFLSSFDDEDIPNVCRRLIEADAKIEARSKPGRQYKEGLDSTYVAVEGTPSSLSSWFVQCLAAWFNRSCQNSSFSGHSTKSVSDTRTCVMTFAIFNYTVFGVRSSEDQGLVLLFFVYFYILAGTFAHMVVAPLPDATTAGRVVTILFSMMILFAGVFQTPIALPGFWIFMYRVSPMTYLVGGVAVSGLSGDAIICSQAELAVFQPPAGETCGAYMQPYLEQAAPGTLLNPDATASCSYCPLGYADQVLARSGMYYDERWRDWGLGFIYIAFNIAAVFAFYYLFRLRVWGLWIETFVEKRRQRAV
ncbi:ZEB2-regulated ABC transporter 1 [Fusarium oxysporum f. sp. conglutinans]|nr:ZEB2-regulated ABC transporter 1 [Fusarium oxysporum f. sp. conglutinans]